MNYGVIVAAGRSERMGGKVDKAFLSLGMKPVLAHSLTAFEKCSDIAGVILVVRKDRVGAARNMAQMFGCTKVKRVVAGGVMRQVSVENGLAVLGEDVGIVVVHDGARPCVTPELISETIKTAKRYGSGVAAVRITDTVKQVDKGYTVKKTLDRTKLWAVQTPQTFKREILEKSFAIVKKKGAKITDEASALELAGQKVHLVPATVSNIKVTAPEDLSLAAALLGI
ncbi:MAG: 2-C-methyl-D-erythritol 4-phosphate cytidylyltransferase [Lentisphaerae bacterium]|nr:2-C-methyl-D-erythritol 4-phosphate cytidylyltransferase [Lentisphaerota bacterium]